MEKDRIFLSDALQGMKQLPDNSIQCCVTSPPYWKARDYNIDGQYGMEASPALYVQQLVAVFNEVKRVLKPNGTLWLNVADVYWTDAHRKGRNGHHNPKYKKPGQSNASIDVQDSIFDNLKAKDLIGIPWILAFALRNAGWHLRQDIIWHKPNAMPERVVDRCAKSHEYLFLFSKSARYLFNPKAIREPAAYDGRKDTICKGSPKYRGQNITFSGNAHPRWQLDDNGLFVRNKRSVWSIPLKPFSGPHVAPFPEQLPLTCIIAGTDEGDTVLDPFMGAGTTAIAAKRLKRYFIGLELNPQSISIAEKRLLDSFGLFQKGMY
ncbi:DNA-methyltransferase [Chitinophaga niabensis]|uniref:Methyltransferase n=1 Tax=Chitinophaga niabensis TaxID=536979 RepID=A0A1N6E575_9BACT|nr:site-specific DNA-methyltransferase [Chitinophaga niabensis]SIN78123.1 DNA modification methylase [Chitinophaga niabensis]